MSFFEWLIGEPGAAWIIGVLGFAGAFFLNWWTRQRPSKVIIQEIGIIRLLDIHDSQRNRIRVSYRQNLNKDIPISNLFQEELVLYNSGTRDIEQVVNIKLGISDNVSDLECTNGVQGFFDLFFPDGQLSEEIKVEKEYLAEDLSGSQRGKISKVKISLPYLNSYESHKAFAKGYLLSEKPIFMKLESGSGKGWSSRLISLEEQTPSKDMIGVCEKISMTLYIVGAISFLSMLILVNISYVKSGSPEWDFFRDPNPENIERMKSFMINRLDSIKNSNHPWFDYYYYGIRHYWRNFWVAVVSVLMFLAGFIIENMPRHFLWIKNSVSGIQGSASFQHKD